jgi:hypothetical protein
MAKNVIFFVHGMGQHYEGWSTEDNGPIAKLSKSSEYYSGFSPDLPSSNSAECIEIRYDTFGKILARRSELVNALRGKRPGYGELLFTQRSAAQTDSDNATATEIGVDQLCG